MRVQVRGANDANATWFLLTKVDERFSLTLRASVPQTKDAPMLGEALHVLRDEAIRYSA